MHISANLSHISGISRLLVKIGRQDVLFGLVVKIVFKIEVISSPSASIVSILAFLGEYRVKNCMFDDMWKKWCQSTIE